MKSIVKRLYEEAPRDWDGDFLSLDDHFKDSAVREYILRQGIGTEIFPECCHGAEVLLTGALYSNPIKFFALYEVMVVNAEGDEQFKSEAIDDDEAQDLAVAFCDGDDIEVARIFGDAAYKYCEDALRDACYWQLPVIKMGYTA